MKFRCSIKVFVRLRFLFAQVSLFDQDFLFNQGFCSIKILIRLNISILFKYFIRSGFDSNPLLTKHS
jgi:hypothetical protein